MNYLLQAYSMLSEPTRVTYFVKSTTSFATSFTIGTCFFTTASTVCTNPDNTYTEFAIGPLFYTPSTSVHEVSYGRFATGLFLLSTQANSPFSV